MMHAKQSRFLWHFSGCSAVLGSCPAAYSTPAHRPFGSEVHLVASENLTCFRSLTLPSMVFCGPVLLPALRSQTFSWSPNSQPGIQVARSIWARFHESCTSWFDHDQSGNTAICVVYTRGTPVQQKKSVPPWEPGSLPPPFLAAMRRANGADTVTRAAPAAGR